MALLVALGEDVAEQVDLDGAALRVGVVALDESPHLVSILDTEIANERGDQPLAAVGRR